MKSKYDVQVCWYVHSDQSSRSDLSDQGSRNDWMTHSQTALLFQFKSLCG